MHTMMKAVDSSSVTSLTTSSSSTFHDSFSSYSTGPSPSLQGTAERRCLSGKKKLNGNNRRKSTSNNNDHDPYNKNKKVHNNHHHHNNNQKHNHEYLLPNTKELSLALQHLQVIQNQNVQPPRSAQVALERVQEALAALEEQLAANNANLKNNNRIGNNNNNNNIRNRRPSLSNMLSNHQHQLHDGRHQPRKLVPRHVLYAAQPTPPALTTMSMRHPQQQQQPANNVNLFRATYAANAPNEDRSTVVVGDYATKTSNNNNTGASVISMHNHHPNVNHQNNNNNVEGDFMFAGVWDGHGGSQCSEFTQATIFDRFAKAFWAQQQLQLNQGNTDLKEYHDEIVSQAFVQAFKQTDQDYYHYARKVNQENVFFAGTCAVACWVDWQERALWCANLGDSRAVMAQVMVGDDDDANNSNNKNNKVGADCRLQITHLSDDHSAANPREQERIRALHPNDPHVVADMTQIYPNHYEPGALPDWRVKKMAGFTRSIGDLQLKEKNTAAMYNSYMTQRPQDRVTPRPGVVNKHTGEKTLPYISTEPEIKHVSNLPDDGFVILACDGVWDEMSSEEAVYCVAKLLAEQKNGSNPANEKSVADLFVDQVLERAVQRLRQTDEYEANLTLDELKRRPPGKGADCSRSFLHDDITVVIVQWGSTESFFHQKSAKLSSKTEPSGPSLNDFFCNSGTRSNSSRTLSRASVVGRSLEDQLMQMGGDQLRRQADNQIVEMMELFEGMNTRHLAILFNALDVNGNGSLDRDEVGRLISKAMSSDILPAVVDMAFDEMDEDGSGEVDFEEFVAFFGHSQGVSELMELFQGLNKRHLKIIFNALDVDGNGSLDRDEIGRLINQGFMVDVHPAVVDVAFEEMDKDGSGAVDFEEFLAFFASTGNEQPKPIFRKRIVGLSSFSMNRKCSAFCGI